MNKKNEVKIIGTFYFKMRDGGIEKVVALLIRKWIGMGFNVVLFTDEEKNEEDYIEEHEVNRVILESNPVLIKKRRDQIQHTINQYNIDVMVYHAWGNPYIKEDREVFQENGIPFIVYTHGIFSTIYHDRNKYTPFFLEEIKKCDTILSLTRVSQRFYELIGLRSLYIQNPIDPELIEEKVSGLTEKTVIWIGRMIPEKKPKDAIRIIELVKKKIPDIKLLMVGKGPEEATIRKMIEKNKLGKHVELIGYTKKVEEYYKKASVMLFTSMYEGFSMVLLESKAFGLPCVMYDLPYLSMVKDSAGIRVVEQGDVLTAADEITKILLNQKLCKDLGSQARKSLEEMYNSYSDSQWRDIFSQSFFEYDRCIGLEGELLELLIDHEEYGVTATCKRIYNSKTYRIGKLILKFPKFMIGWKRGCK